MTFGSLEMLLINQLTTGLQNMKAIFQTGLWLVAGAIAIAPASLAVAGSNRPAMAIKGQTPGPELRFKEDRRSRST